MGQTAPWLQEVKKLAIIMPWPTRVLVGVSNMAQLMADSDLAIGAAGATAWERCCLGLPSIMLVVADNQMKIANELEQNGAALLCLSFSDLQSKIDSLLKLLSTDCQKITFMCKAASKVVDGAGTHSVLKLMSLA
jgi:spore coat polysaccharide biosynthesis predicted glycosyltransferase SpsG